MISIDNVGPSSTTNLFRIKWSTWRTTHYSLVVRSPDTKECRWQKTGKLCPVEVDLAINEWENRELH